MAEGSLNQWQKEREGALSCQKYTSSLLSLIAVMTGHAWHSNKFSPPLLVGKAGHKTRDAG